jgi:EmrB/QacA subfamily drug resistance transporter
MGAQDGWVQGRTEAAPKWTWGRLMIEPRRHSSVRERPNAHWFAVAAVCVGALMGQLDASIVTVALPSMQESFHASLGAVTWVGLSYLVVLVATVTAIGRFADMWGRKLLYIYGFVVFIVASLLCGLAPDLAALCGFRALQAIGAAMLQANSLAIIVLVVPGQSLGRAVGLQGAAQAIGLSLGPSLGGVLLAAGGWRLIFLVNIPLGVFGALAAVALVPRSRHLQQTSVFDWRGLTLFFPAVVAVLTAISFGASLGWSSPTIILLFAIAATLAIWFVRHERSDAHPMLDPGLFKNLSFSAGIASGTASYAVMFGVLLLIPFYLARGLGLGTARIGLELVALPISFGLVAPVAGRTADRIGARRLTVSGMTIVVFGLLTLALCHPGTLGLVLLLAAVGGGLGLFTSPNNATIMRSVPPQQVGMASGILNMSRGIGTALGLALTGLLFALNGGAKGTALQSAHAFRITALALAGIAGLGAMVAALAPSHSVASPQTPDPLTSRAGK